jgi:4-hydroxy-tetrahydrodipicolinate synthase
LRHLIEAGGDAIEGPFDGEESITLMADLDAGATGTMPSALLPDLIKPVLTQHRGAGETKPRQPTRISSLHQLRNRQCGLRATKTVMAAGGVISDAVRHPLKRHGNAEGLLELARELNRSRCAGEDRGARREAGANTGRNAASKIKGRGGAPYFEPSV